jgi:hypothetical protein
VVTKAVLLGDRGKLVNNVDMGNWEIFVTKCSLGTQGEP